MSVAIDHPSRLPACEGRQPRGEQDCSARLSGSSRAGYARANPVYNLARPPRVEIPILCVVATEVRSADLSHTSEDQHTRPHFIPANSVGAGLHDLPARAICLRRLYTPYHIRKRTAVRIRDPRSVQPLVNPGSCAWDPIPTATSRKPDIHPSPQAMMCPLYTLRPAGAVSGGHKGPLPLLRHGAPSAGVLPYHELHVAIRWEWPPCTCGRSATVAMPFGELNCAQDDDYVTTGTGSCRFADS
jgi:hypothetical protein